MIKLILLPDKRYLKMHKITSKFLIVNNISLSVWMTSLARSWAVLQNHPIHFSKSKWHLAVTYLQRWKLNLKKKKYFKSSPIYPWKRLSSFKLAYYCTKEVRGALSFNAPVQTRPGQPVVLTEYGTHGEEGHLPWQLNILRPREENMKFNAPV